MKTRSKSPGAADGSIFPASDSKATQLPFALSAGRYESALAGPPFAARLTSAVVFAPTSRMKTSDDLFVSPPTRLPAPLLNATFGPSAVMDALPQQSFPRAPAAPLR